MAKLDLQVGDKVIVKKRLARNSNCGWNSSMSCYIGRESTVTLLLSYSMYVELDGGYCFDNDDEYLERVNEKLIELSKSNYLAFDKRIAELRLKPQDLAR